MTSSERCAGLEHHFEGAYVLLKLIVLVGQIYDRVCKPTLLIAWKIGSNQRGNGKFMFESGNLIVVFIKCLSLLNKVVQNLNLARLVSLV